MAPLALAAALAGPAPAPAQDGKAQLAFGVQMARRGLWSEALFRFRQAEKADPSNVRVLNNLAVAYEAVGKFDEALETYQRALRIDASERSLKRNYARFIEFYQAFKPQESESGKAAEAAEGAAPQDPDVANKG